MKKLVLSFLGVFLFAQIGLAQKQVSGTVIDASDSTGIPGINVVEKGTTNGTITDLDGKYSIMIKDDAVLVFSFLGMKTKRVTVGNQSTIDVKMETETEGLDEIIVTALGIKREKKTLTYNVQDMDGEDIVRSRQDNLLNAFQGNISGVQITSTGGAPGSSTEIILRGATSVDGNNQPLFVVDGIPISNATIDGTTNRAADINPDDIANVSVLKGAAAAALYGIEAANGAIIITTKSGKEGKTQVGVNTSVTASRVGHLHDQQDVYTTGYNGVYSSKTFASWGPAFRRSDVRYDNIDNFFNTGFAFRYGANISGGTDKLTYFLSAADLTDKGMVPNASYDKTSINLKVSTNLFDKLTLTVSSNIIKTENNYGIVGTSGGWLSYAYKWPRWDDMSVYETPDGSEKNIWIPTSGEMSTVPDNPWWTAYHNVRNDAVSRNITGLNLHYDIADGIALDYRVGRDYYSQHYKAVKEWGTRSSTYYEGYIDEFTLESERISSILIATYDKTFAENYRLTVIAGHSIQADALLQTRITGTQFKNPELLSINNLKDIQQSQYTKTKRVVGVFGDVKFDIFNMILLGGTIRNDWSSTLPFENRSFYYPSGSFGFIFSELTKDIFKPLSFGKLRFSIAKVGKDAPPHKLTQTLSQFYGIGGGWKNGAFAGNPILMPEITSEIEFGIDLRFFVGRLSLDATYYKRTSNDQIITPRVTPVTGAILQTVNSGSVENKGIELLITGIPVKKNDYEWKVIVNMFGNRSKLTKLFGDLVEFPVTFGQVTSVAIASSKLNEPLFAIVGTDYERTEDGKVIVGNDGIPLINTEKNYIGNREPKLRYGLTNSFRYKNFNISLLLDGAYSADILNATAYGLLHNGNHAMLADYRNKEFIFEGVVENEGTYEQNATPIIMDYYYFRQNYGLVGTNFVENVSWLRVRNITFEYILPQSIAKRIKASDIRVNVGANNLYLLTNYSGGDPEVNNAGPNGGASGAGTMGVDYYQVPVSKTVTLGINIKF